MEEDSQSQPAEERKCAVAGFGFENGHPVPVANPDFTTIELAEISENQRVKIWMAGAVAGITLASAGKTVERKGARAELLAYVVGKSHCKTQTSLASFLGVSKGTVSLELNTVKVELGRQLDVLLASLK